MIQPEFKPLSQILSDKLFKIPEYQRHYSWGSKQRKELFSDIIALQDAVGKNPDRIHFMATVVCLQTAEREAVGSNAFTVFEVVDGQQRITTLVILLKAIALHLAKDAGTEDEAREIDKLLVKGDKRLIILQNNHDNRSILRNYLEAGVVPTKDHIKTEADENLRDAIEECQEFVAKGEDIITLLSLIKNQLYLIFQALTDKGAVYTIFEVLNSRGLEVDWLDKCKSMLMGILYENSGVQDGPDRFEAILNELHAVWSEIYRQIGLRGIRGEEIVRFAATLQTESNSGRPLSAEDSLEYFRSDSCRDNGDSGKVIDKVIRNTYWLREVVACLAKLYDDKRRNAVTAITQARLLAVAIMMRNDLSDDERSYLLNQWERTTFRIYGLLRKDSRTRVGDYVRAAKRIQRDSDSSMKDLIRTIVDIGAGFTIDEAVEELNRLDSYMDWQTELRYFLYRYEEHLSESAKSEMNAELWIEVWRASASNTIEHVLPQEYGQPGWEHFSQDQHNECLHVLGNLCILPPSLNSKAGVKPFAEKKEVYRMTKLRMMDGIMNKDDGSDREVWDSEIIKERTKMLIEFARNQWSDLS